MRDYEVLYIVRADLDDDKVQDAVKRVNTLIERSGGTIERTNLWGKRKLAYEVKHQKEGAYVLQDFQLEPSRVPELESSLKITEEVLRHLVVRKPEKAAPVTAVAPPPAEVVPQYTRKGALVYIEGRIQTRSWEGQDGQKRRTTEIIANDVQFLDSRSGGPTDGTPRQRPAASDDIPAPDDAPRDVDPDEIPF